MNMKKAKKSDLDEVKKTIKKEKADLYPLANYIEDRIELGKQIFNSLKPKTIKNLAPDFLKNSTIEDIQELCSTELLGISTKRLCSIISATKCPSDTESSDSDGRVEEHVSLEEISSDSEDCTRKIQDKKNKRKVTVTNSQDNKKNYKEISVLELLELQARARAIRSQLALEPIAKIEVDSDDSTKSHGEKCTQSTKKRHSDNHSVDTEQKEPNKCSPNGDFSGNSFKRIKLKRNFRKTMECNIPEGQTAEGSKSEENSAPISDNDVKKEKSPSPDVITILLSPETLCISDSSDEECNIPGNKIAPEKNNSVNVEDEVDNVDNKNYESDIEEGEILDKDDDEKIVKIVQLEKPYINKEAKSKNNLEENSNEGHHNDDVISLEHEELDDESKENIDVDCTSAHYTEIKEERSLIVPCSQLENTDNFSEPVPYIELDGDTSESGNEQDGKEENLHEESTSWNCRWLKSSKVSRILAVSKLGNRVRENLRQKKKSVQEQVETIEHPEDFEEYLCNFEDGSIQQYHDLLHRETSSSKEQ